MGLRFRCDLVSIYIKSTVQLVIYSIKCQLSKIRIKCGYASAGKHESKTPYWMTRSKLEGGDWDEHWVLCPSLVNCRQNAAPCWPLYSTYARTKDDRQLMFHLH